ncbi:CLUMA_CG019605, isoform A [Clunio marinus]|uniref:tRNA selenocysteine-associated protein 1 n=1 Tax=Clunio marinus TaxID=568069 RepID=A0A1J1J2Z5_9DIPT|nr:CLUMA_CG019605, isoform A [Clunio marinus]
MAQQCQLWMGSLQPYMTENFILAAFRKMGEDPLTVKLMKNKFSGEPAGYCFVSFVTDEAAQLAMHKLNGKPIPGTNPIVRFKLNCATTSQNKALLADREFSVWVGDLSSDVDDYNLYRVFSAKYQSIKTAKVIMDDSGFSRGYGFVKFGLEEEQKSALYEMNGFIGLGSKALKICSAVPKPKDGSAPAPAAPSATTIVQQVYDQAYSQYYYDQYSQYWQQQGYGYENNQQMDPSVYYSQQAAAMATTAPPVPVQTPSYSAPHSFSNKFDQDDDYALVDHKIHIDVEKLNRETVDMDRNFYDSLESNRSRGFELFLEFLIHIFVKGKVSYKCLIKLYDWIILNYNELMKMKFSTANIKNGDYNEQHVLYVGTQTGSVKRVDIFNEDNPYKQSNLQSLESLNRDSKITCLSWADEGANELLIGRGDSIIRTFDCNMNQFCGTDLEIPDGKVVGLAWNNETIVAASDNGKIHILNDTSAVLEAGDNISHMQQCPQNKKLIAVGGKERQNNLKVFDLETQKEIFKSKNIPHDNLQLEVPVWDSDLSFVNNSDACLATCSRYGYIRFYDYRQQRRPVNNYTDNRDQAFNSLAEHNGIVFVSTTTGGLFAFDLKNMRVPLHTYKGATGSISSIAVDETGKFLFTASLDRYVRAHNIEKTNLLYQCYVKSKASQIVMKQADQRLLNTQKEQKDQKTEESDEEYDNLFDKMQTVDEDDDEPSSKKPKVVKTSGMKRHSGIVCGRDT